MSEVTYIRRVTYENGEAQDRELSQSGMIEEAHRVLRAEYFDDVRRIATDAAAEYPKRADEEDRRTYIEESVESALIYNFDILDCLRYTEHDDAYEEMVGDLTGLVDRGDGVFALYQKIASYAMLADVQAYPVDDLLVDDEEEAEEDEEDEDGGDA